MKDLLLLMPPVLKPSVIQAAEWSMAGPL